MEGLEIFQEFIEATNSDARIGIAHIGLYATLFQKWIKQQYQGPVESFSHEIMQDAKISSSATYHKLIRQLSAYGYINYHPSFYKRKASRIFLHDFTATLKGSKLEGVLRHRDR